MLFRSVIMLIATCFGCTLYYFYAFSGTNLLARCQVPVSCFLLFFVLEKLHRKYSRNCTGRKPTVIYCHHLHGDQRRDGGGLWSPHTTWRRGSHPQHTAMWCGALGPPTTFPLRPYKPLCEKTLDTRSQFHEKFRHRRRHQP